MSIRHAQSKIPFRVRSLFTRSGHLSFFLAFILSASSLPVQAAPPAVTAIRPAGNGHHVKIIAPQPAEPTAAPTSAPSGPPSRRLLFIGLSLMSAALGLGLIALATFGASQRRKR